MELATVTPQQTRWLQELREKHQPEREAGPDGRIWETCKFDNDNWPCDIGLLVGAAKEMAQYIYCIQNPGDPPVRVRNAINLIRDSTPRLR